MTSKRWTTAGIGMLLLLGTAAPAAAAPPVAPGSSGSTAGNTADARGASAPTTKVKTVKRSYGAGPVKTKGGATRITFTGRKGDLVHLDAATASSIASDVVDFSTTTGTIKLRKGNRQVRSTWSGFWTLPRSGAYTFVFKAKGANPIARTLQLQLVRTATAELDGKAVPARKQKRGYLDAVSVSLAAGDRALMTTPAFQNVLLMPDGKVRSTLGRELQLEVGRAVQTTSGGGTLSPLKAGRLLVLNDTTGATTRATRSVVAPITVDGPTVDVTSDGQRREHVFTFDVAAGDVLVPDFHGTSSGTTVLQGTGGHLQEPTPTSGAYWFSGSGTVNYSVITGGRTGVKTTLSLVKALRAPDVTDISTPVTLANVKPGQYVAVGLPQGVPSPSGLTASGAAFTSTDGSAPAWSVQLEPRAPGYCKADLNAPLGCGEYYPLTVDQGAPTATRTALYGYTGDSLLLAVPPTVSGRVTITLAK